MRTFILSALLLGVALFPERAFAEIDPTAKNLEFTRLECSITSVDRSALTIQACETAIRLVDVSENDRRLRTILASATRQPVSLDTFHENQRIFVRGFRQSDGSLVAREIYQLPPGEDRRQDLRFYHSIPDWEWESLE
ncbi:MAG: hypothetical protein WC952_16960 [Desulfobulbaceae bacterium]